MRYSVDYLIPSAKYWVLQDVLAFFTNVLFSVKRRQIYFHI